MPYQYVQQFVPSAEQLESDRAAVQAVYPSAVFKTEGDFGRIVAGDRLISLAFSLVDPDAEGMAFHDASLRLGDGSHDHHDSTPGIHYSRFLMD